MTIENVKPCPFCGGTDLVLQLSYIECYTCTAYGPSYHVPFPFTQQQEITQSLVKELWNNRAEHVPEAASVTVPIPEPTSVPVAKHKYYFTLSESQGGPGCIEVEAEDYHEARNKMVNSYGAKWAFQYDSIDAVHPFDREVLDNLY